MYFSKNKYSGIILLDQGRSGGQLNSIKYALSHPKAFSAGNNEKTGDGAAWEMFCQLEYLK